MAGRRNQAEEHRLGGCHSFALANGVDLSRLNAAEKKIRNVALKHQIVAVVVEDFFEHADRAQHNR